MKLDIDAIRQTAYDIHHYLGNGYLEKIYERALQNRLCKKGISCRSQTSFSVFDEDGTLLGEFIPDLWVDGDAPLLIEVKAVQTIHAAHVAQVLGYMRATGIHEGLLINFGGTRFQIRKFII